MSASAEYGMRVAAVLAIWTAGAVHLWLYAHDDYSAIHVIGTLFLLNGIAAALIGVALFVSASLLVTLGGIGYAVATLIAFVVSATEGLFGWKEVWSGVPQEVAGFTELAALVLLLLVAASILSRSGRTRLAPRSRQSPQ
jgi:hypothetical protein